jgi:transposase
VEQKSQLEELAERRGHLAFFYPKYHCELNHIENYWGWSKRRFSLSIHVHTHTHIHTHTHTYTHTHAHTHTVHIHTLTDRHMRTQTNFLLLHLGI